ncbi:MAG: phage holin family protein [Candidatus Limnocylindrales bacterium]
MRSFIIGTAVTAVAFFILVQLLPSMFGYKGGYISLIVIAIVFGVVNGFVGPVVKTLAMPITFMTMGLVGFVINGALLLVTAFVTDLAGFTLTVGDFPPDLLTADTLVAAVVGAVVLSLITTVVGMVVPD